MFDDPKFIAAAVILVTNVAALVKVYTDLMRVKAQRAETKTERDTDSANMHDQLLKHEFSITNLKDSIALHNTVITDLQATMNELNTNCAKLGVVVDTLTDAVKELKNAKD